MDIPVYTKSSCINSPSAIVAEFGACGAATQPAKGRAHLGSTVPAAAACGHGRQDEAFEIGVTTERSGVMVSLRVCSDGNACKHENVDVGVMMGANPGVPGKLLECRNLRCLISACDDPAQHEPEHDLPQLRHSRLTGFPTVHTSVDCMLTGMFGGGRQIALRGRSPTR
jgi:hypothetical protein